MNMSESTSNVREDGAGTYLIAGSVNFYADDIDSCITRACNN